MTNYPSSAIVLVDSLLEADYLILGVKIVVIKDKKTIKSPTLKAKKIAKKSDVADNTPKKQRKGPLAIIFKIGGYFKGSWGELRQVRWPNRKSAWGLTLAVLLFTGFFLVLIVLLDAGFKQLFNFILK